MARKKRDDDEPAKDEYKAIEWEEFENAADMYWYD